MTYHWLWMVPCLWSSKGKWELLACAKTAVLLPLKCTLAVKGLDIIIQPPPFTSEGLPYLMRRTLSPWEVYIKNTDGKKWIKPM